MSLVLRFPGVQKPLDQYGPAAAAAGGGAAKEEEDEDDDDDIDLFGSDDEVRNSFSAKNMILWSCT